MRHASRIGRLAVALAAAASLFCPSAFAAATRPNVVTTQQGRVSGVPTPFGLVFKAIPYAEPPVGALRWRAPRPARAWTGIKSANTFGAPCAQAPLRNLTELSSISREDCLFLNVWTPRARAGARLPVMVWIHGGGFANGAGSSPTFDGKQFASRGVILVTLNYRLGVFGFLAHPELTVQSGKPSSGNFGLADQIAALRWVKANIAGFGGDPNNVTIFGQSAGGASVIDLMTSPLARGLFGKAIVQSGAALGAIRAAELREAEQQGLAFAAGRSVALLRTVPAEELLRQYVVFSSRGGRLGPVIDGVLLPEEPARVFAEGRQRKVPLIIGSNAREALGSVAESGLAGAIAKAFGQRAGEALRAYGLGAGQDQRVDPLLGGPAAQFATDTSFRCGSVKTAGDHARASAPVWQYQFEQFVRGREKEGAAHSFEVPYVFGHLSRSGFAAADYGPADRAVSDVMNAYWANFARRGDPNGAGLPEWPLYSPVGRAYLRFSSGLPGDALAATDLRGSICNLLTSPS